MLVVHVNLPHVYIGASVSGVYICRPMHAKWAADFNDIHEDNS